MKKYLIVLITFSIVFYGCDNEEYFELERAVQAPWLSLNDFEKAPIGAYYALSGNAGFRSIFDHGPVAGELFADGANLAPITAGFSTNGDAEEIYDRAIGNQIGLFDNAIFNSAYFAIGNSNGGLDFIEENDGDPYPEANRPDEVNRIKGELLFVRAYAYFWLARIYMPAYPNDEIRIPFRVNSATNFDEALTSELGSTNDLYELMVSDLEEAVELLPEQYEEGVHHPSYADGRATKFAAAALLAKVLFQMNRHDDALDPLNLVIDQNNGVLDLNEDPIEAFNKTGAARGSETIWYYTLWAGDGLGGASNWKHPGRFEWYNAQNRFASGPQSTNGRFIVASDSFLEEVGWQDASGDETAEALADKRFRQLFMRFTPTGSGETVADNIYPEPNATFNTTRDYVWNNRYYRAGNRNTNVPILRLADMYLLRAIIRAQNGETVGAISDLNMVRNRAGLADYAGDASGLEEAIHQERFKEMAFEGDRLYYLQGLRMDIPSGDRGSAAIPWDSPLYSEIPDYEKQINQAF